MAKQMRKVVKKDITELTFLEVAQELTDNGFSYVDQIGARANNGYVFAYGDDYVEVWDNTDMKTPNIAIRPKKSTADGLPLVTWERELKGECTITAPKGNTIRIKCVTMHALAMVLYRCIAEIKRIEKRAKKTVKKVETETAVSVA